ncbi:uncharacterized protein BP01DRAFT_323342 [Aspergillus saccharolyticus JOP 1030-1]|uniref:Uncharacterized protein n=1 Tax=Aspergillus saccharolyticus JOP 1030-1 TaxID=1450539 RepID=A0A318Z7P2_9EURO|nr:hypothetical protein BP01DRAFT_323342 [Aspergillus saccharolyticus JOP 1030-1]PYH43321.1 hypothetical protein BP01DRAFT_323342 [Aspergillus saccharolyticus JOP 1030-1]
MATTPPPPSRLRVPPTPRHGAKYDHYEPYSTRFSSRLASQRASRESQTTPPPSFPPARQSSKLPKKQNVSESATLSPPGSIQSSPRKQKSGRLFGTHSLAHPALDESDPFNTEPSHSRPPQSFRPTLTEGMLPTPAKTPRKKAVADVGNTARVLFPPPSGSNSRRKPKKHTGFSLDSFTEDYGQSSTEIKIYTDSRDRIPEVDKSEGNPFNKKPGSNTGTRTSRRKEMIREKEVDESVKREDGMVYVFRGKKVFRKFTDDVDSCAEDDDDDDLGLLAARPDLIDEDLVAKLRPLTRSSIKPRVLFRAAASDAQLGSTGNADEEAATDIEDQVLDVEAEEIDNVEPDLDVLQRPVTPPLRTATATPPSLGGTVRSLRSRTKPDDTEQSDNPSTSGSETKRKRVSPFDGWLRRKQTPALVGNKAKKRDADAAASPGGPVPKKTRSNRATASTS